MSLPTGYLSRRQVVAELGAGLLTRPLGAFAAPASGKPDVLVIGAGLSGLYATLLLEELGATVYIIESRSRVGGKIDLGRDGPQLDHRCNEPRPSGGHTTGKREARSKGSPSRRSRVSRNGSGDDARRQYRESPSA